MQGYKIEYVKETLKYILSLLNENDRLCLIEFNTGSRRLTPLKKADKNNE
jgi:hypothetical protein